MRLYPRHCFFLDTLTVWSCPVFSLVDSGHDHCMFHLLGVIFSIWLRFVYYLTQSLTCQICLFALRSSQLILCCALKKSFHCMVCVFFIFVWFLLKTCVFFLFVCFNGSFYNQLKTMNNAELVCFPHSIISFSSAT